MIAHLWVVQLSDGGRMGRDQVVVSEMKNFGLEGIRQLGILIKVDIRIFSWGPWNLIAHHSEGCQHNFLRFCSRLCHHFASQRRQRGKMRNYQELILKKQIYCSEHLLNPLKVLRTNLVFRRRFGWIVLHLHDEHVTHEFFKDFFNIVR